MSGNTGQEVTIDTEAATKLADDLCDYFKKNAISKVTAMAAMMVLIRELEGQGYRIDFIETVSDALQ